MFNLLRESLRSYFELASFKLFDFAIVNRLY